MNSKMKFGVVMALVLVLSVFGTSVVSAHYCTPPEKPIGAGSVGTVDLSTGTATMTQKNGGFITITGIPTADGGTATVDVFLHGVRPDRALASGPDGSSQCDGRGIDNALVCLGVEP